MASVLGWPSLLLSAVIQKNPVVEIMKIRLLAVCALVFFALNVNVAVAKTMQESRVEADRYYKQQEFRKAYKSYSKLAKKGDHHSQHQLSKMYANGEGRKVDENEAYAWSVLAAEGGEKKWQDRNAKLAAQLSSKSKAQEKAAKRMRNYGQDALAEKQKEADKRGIYRGASSCTGSRLACKYK